MILGAVAGIVGPAGSASAAPAPNCTIHADVPTYSGGNIVYSGGATCNYPLFVEITLQDNGSNVADTETDCGANVYCSDLGLHPNRQGNQQWCSVVRVVVFTPGMRDYGTKKACETANW
ncbi:hypothetical protein [Dactylosporangium sp. NPDC000521]|uniref:hypothetical protein n=1 Tax=Dactylosporangium sp. NPDC000521 TaxID=3363975 RepID=UPI0036A91050